MPSKTPKQKKFMQAACKSKKFADKTGMSRKVACEFYEKDKKK